jgi:predicted Zn-dependent protease
VILRLLLGAAALAAAALLVVWLGSSRAEERASRVAFSAAAEDGEQVERALADARHARRAVPDGPAKFVEWRLLYVSGRGEQAQRLLDQMLRDEPHNTGPWFVLLNTTGDRERARQARARLQELNPALLERER